MTDVNRHERDGTIKDDLVNEVRYACQEKYCFGASGIKCSEYYVYFIEADDKYIKIGISYDVDKRMKDLDIANPTTLVLVSKLQIPNRLTALRLEERLHKKFEKFHIKGEWFEKSTVIIEYAYEACRLASSYSVI